MAEWLGRALQKLLQRFESARNLQRTCVSAKPLVRAVFLLGKESMRACSLIDGRPDKNQAGRSPVCIADRGGLWASPKRRITGGVVTPEVIRSKPQDVAHARKTAFGRFFLFRQLWTSGMWLDLIIVPKVNIHTGQTFYDLRQITGRK